MIRTVPPQKAYDTSDLDAEVSKLVEVFRQNKIEANTNAIRRILCHVRKALRCTIKDADMSMLAAVCKERGYFDKRRDSITKEPTCHKVKPVFKNRPTNDIKKLVRNYTKGKQ